MAKLWKVVRLETAVAALLDEEVRIEVAIYHRLGKGLDSADRPPSKSSVILAALRDRAKKRERSRMWRRQGGGAGKGAGG